jgi:Rieske Fe-S protein
LKYIQFLAAKQPFKKMDNANIEGTVEKVDEEESVSPITPEVSRRRFLSRMTLTIGGIIAVIVGGIMSVTSLVPAMRKRPEKWVKVGRVKDFPEGVVKTVPINYTVKDGIYESTVSKPVFVRREPGSDNVTVFNSRCTHLACVLHWDEKKKLFLCDCHGGQFYPDGRVKAGPPPRPMDRYATKVQNGNILVREA